MEEQDECGWDSGKKKNLVLILHNRKSVNYALS